MNITQDRRTLGRAVAVPLCAIVALVLLAMAAPDIAIAAPNTPDGSGFGDNLGDEVKSIAAALLFGVVGLVAIPALARRDLGQAMVIALIAIVIGLFVWGDGAVETIIQNISQQLT